MNHYPKDASQSDTRLDDHILRIEHHVFTNYAQKLSSVISDYDWTKVLELSQLILDVRRRRGRVYLCGNGGSAANAVHIANDLVYAVAEKTGAGIDAVSYTHL